jgi:hypothetical protein
MRKRGVKMSKFTDMAPDKHKKFAVDIEKYHPLFHQAKKLFSDELISTEEFKKIKAHYDKLVSYGVANKILLQSPSLFQGIKFNGWPEED